MSMPNLADMVETNTTTDVVNLLLGVANNIGLSLSSWNPLGVGRAIVQSVSTIISLYTNTVADLAQGGYASYAAQMRGADGSDVTQWLDLRGQDQYNVLRRQATYASCASTGFSVTTGTTAGGTFQAGQFHVANPTTGATYTNTAAVNFLANQSTPCPIQADVPGTASSSGAGQITQLVTPIAGATCTNSAALVGTNIETNAGYFARCVTKLGAISTAGPAAAYDFAVQTLTQVDPAGVLPSPPYLLSGGAITRSFTRANTQTGVVTTVCGNSTGAVLGAVASILTVTFVSGTTWQIATTTPHGLTLGAQFLVTGCVGSSGLNYGGTAATVWTVAAVIDQNNVQVNVGAVGVGAYVSGGTVYGGDLGLCNFVVQANVVGQCILSTVQSIQAIAISPMATVYYKKASGLLPGAVQTKVSNSIISYFAGLPVGGVSDSTPDDSVTPLSGIIGAIMSADPSITSVVFSATQALYVVPPSPATPYFTQGDVSMIVASQPIGVPVLGGTSTISAVPK
jgi:hypothetical protein